MDKETINKLLKHKDQDVCKLAEEYNTIMASHYYNSYKTLAGQLADWNDQLSLTKVTVEGRDVTLGKIDLFADKDEKSFERAFKYFSEIASLNETLEKLKVKMSPEDSSRLTKETTDTAYEKALDEIKKK
jgi:hypothetical protein